MSDLTTYRISEVHHLLSPVIGRLRMEAQNGEVQSSTVDDLYQRWLQLETEAVDGRLQAIADAWDNYKDYAGDPFDDGHILSALLGALTQEDNDE